MRSPATPEELFARLAALGIATTTVSHPAAFTVEDGERHVGHLPGVHIKNLFLCDARKAMWLVVVPWNRRLDLKRLAERIGAARISFGSPDRLLRVLGVTPGSVTPFAAINDLDRQVQIVLDAEMMGAEHINVHPLVNTMTTTIAARDLLAFLAACGHAPRIVDLDLG
jgi:Ala-tRNA(Pro) deacylase